MKQLLLLAALTVSSAQAVLAENLVVSEELDKVINKTLKIKETGNNLHYFNSDNGMIGVAVTSRVGKRFIVYVEPDGSFLYAGQSIDLKSGTSQTKKDMDTLPKASLNNIIGEMKSLNLITIGDKSAIDEVFVIADPGCGYCHRTYRSFKPFVDQGLLKVHWVMVDTLGPSSTNAVQGMLGENDLEKRADALHAKMNRMPYNPNGLIMSQGKDKLETNKNFYNSIGGGGVPIVVTNIADDQQLITGAPRPGDIAKLAKLLGLKKLQASNTGN
jgi:protein-disulfide isomerase